jgi:hypothetical protein
VFSLGCEIEVCQPDRAKFTGKTKEVSFDLNEPDLDHLKSRLILYLAKDFLSKIFHDCGKI